MQRKQTGFNKTKGFNLSVSAPPRDTAFAFVGT
jgi:hypothetical protein